MKVYLAAAAILIPVVSIGCARAPTDHELACAGGTLSGLVLGGVVGNRFGGGSGQTAMTALGAAAGGYAGNRYAC